MPFHNTPAQVVHPEDQWKGPRHGPVPPHFIPPPAPAITIDTVPLEGSKFAVASGGTWQAIEDAKSELKGLTGLPENLHTTAKANLVDAINEIDTSAKQAVLATSSIEKVNGAVLSHTAGNLILAGDTRANYVVTAEGNIVTGTYSSGTTTYVLGDATWINVSHSGALVYSWNKSAVESVDYKTQVLGKPKIAGIELVDDKPLTAFGIASLDAIAGFYTKPLGGIPANDLTTAVTNYLIPPGGVNGQYLVKSTGGYSWQNYAGLTQVYTRDTYAITLDGDGTSGATGIRATLQVSTAGGNILEVTPNGLYASFTGAVRYDIPQSITSNQQAVAVSNLGLGDITENFYSWYQQGKTGGAAPTDTDTFENVSTALFHVGEDVAGLEENVEVLQALNTQNLTTAAFNQQVAAKTLVATKFYFLTDSSKLLVALSNETYAQIQADAAGKVNKVVPAAGVVVYAADVSADITLPVSADITPDVIVQRTDTGDIKINSTPLTNNSPTTKGYVDAAIADIDTSGKLDKVVPASGTIVYSADPSGQKTLVVDTATTSNAIVQRQSSGQITVPAAPQLSSDATSKKYVDDAVAEATPTVDNTLAVTSGVLGVEVSAYSGNALSKKADGLYVDPGAGLPAADGAYVLQVVGGVATWVSVTVFGVQP